MARFYAERVAFATPTTDAGNVAIGSRLGPSFRLPSETTIVNGSNPVLLIQEGDDVEIVDATYVSAGPHFTLDTVIFSIIAGVVGTAKMDLNGAAEVRFLPPIAADIALLAKLSETIQTGKHLIGYWDAAGLLRPTTDAADAAAKSESTTNKVNDEYLSFPNAATKYAGLSFRAPKSSDESASLFIELEWKEAPGATAHVGRWQVEAQAQGDGDTIDSAWGTAVAVDDTATSGTRQFTAEIEVTPAGTWAAGDKIHIRIARLGSHANDTLDVAAHLIGVTVHGSINAGNDA